MKKYLFSLGTILLFAIFALNGFSQHGEINKIPHGINNNDNDESPNWPGYALTTGGTRRTTAMNYYGGPIITTPTIYIIWYGNWNQTNGSDTVAGQQLVRDWASAIGGTPYYRLNQSLSVPAYTITGNVIAGSPRCGCGIFWRRIRPWARRKS